MFLFFLALVWFVSSTLSPISCVQFQASSWKSLILKVCRGAYPPLPNHLPYELHYLIKHMFKTNPKDRPSVHTILTSHRISRLLRSHLPPQVETRHTLWVQSDFTACPLTGMSKSVETLSHVTHLWNLTSLCWFRWCWRFY